MAKTYLPSRLAQRLAWMNNFSTQLTTTGTTYGFSAGEKTLIASAISDAIDACNARALALENARAALQDQAAMMNAALDLIRPAVKRLQAAPEMIDSARALYQITIPDSNPSPVPVPTAQPLTIVNIGDAGQHTLKFFSADDPTRRGKPDGTDGTEIYGTIGETAPTPAEMDLLGFTPRESFSHTYAGSDAGKKAWYRSRYFNSRGKGPWGPLASGTIAA